MRDWDGPRPTNVYFARKHFAEHGVAWQSGGRTEAGKKERQRALHALCDEGLATSAQPTGTKTTMARLTDDGDVTARQLCGLPSRWGGWLSREGREPDERRGKPRYLDDIWIAEVRFDGLKNWKHPKGQEALNGSLILTEEMHLPALVRGWLSRSRPSGGIATTS